MIDLKAADARLTTLENDVARISSGVGKLTDGARNLAALLSLVTSPDAVRDRLKELLDAETAAHKAAAARGAARAEHDKVLARDRAEIASERTKLNKLQMQLEAERREFDDSVRRFVAANPEFYRQERARFGTLVRDVSSTSAPFTPRLPWDARG